MDAFARIDRLLSRAVERKEVPGVVAMAATDSGILYEGAFGTARSRRGPCDDARHHLPDRLDDQGGNLGRGDAAGRARQAPARPADRQCAARTGGAAGPGGLRRVGRAPPAPGQAADHAAPPADPHGGVRLRDAGTPISIRYVKATGMPSTSTGKLASLRLPLVFDPGRALGIRHQHRLGRPGSRSGQRPALDVYFREHILPRSA